MNQDNQRQAILHAYLAGIIDGEGSILLIRYKMKTNWNYTYSVRLSAVNTNLKVIQMLEKAFGGHWVIGAKCTHNRQTVYRWQQNGNRQTISTLKILIPFLVIKKTQAILALQFIEKMRWYDYRKGKRPGERCLPESELQRREEFYQKIKKLNAVGSSRNEVSEKTPERVNRYSELSGNGER